MLESGLVCCGGRSGAVGCMGAVFVLALVVLIVGFFMFVVGYQLVDAGVM